LLIPLCSIVMIHYLIVTRRPMHDVRVIEGAGLLIINIITFYIYSAVEESYLENMDKEIAVQTSIMYANQLELIMRTQQEIRSLQHDMKYHIRDLMSMAKASNSKDILSYLENMSELVDNPKELASSGNKEIDSNINYLLRYAREKLIDVNINLKIPEVFFDSSYDISVIIGTLLENAIVETDKTDEKMLSINMVMETSILYIKIINTYNCIIKKRGDKILTSKDNSAYDKNIFRVVIMLYLTDTIA